jgi:hypothetical protein
MKIKDAGMEIAKVEMTATAAPIGPAVGIVAKPTIKKTTN